MTSSKTKTNTSKAPTKSWRSRGWIPLKYPKSAFSENAANGSFIVFPLHKDVISACLRELLILDESLDPLTMTVSRKESIYNIQNDLTSIQSYRKHTEFPRWPRDLEEEYIHCEGSRKSMRSNITKANGLKASNLDSIQQGIVTAEDIIDKIISERVRVHFDDGKSTLPSNTTCETTRPPRKVSEADCTTFTTTQRAEENDYDFGIISSQEIAEVLDLRNRIKDRPLRKLTPIHSIVHASIANEAALREIALSLTRKLLASFQDKALRHFLGYKAPNIGRQKLIQIISSFLFDTSHAMYAWEQTEQDVLTANPNAKRVDTTIHRRLFDARALKKIGGFETSSLLPHAISIGRLRRQNVSWKDFALTDQGKRMFSHHGSTLEIIAAGKRRRGERLKRLSVSRHLAFTDADNHPIRSCTLFCQDESSTENNRASESRKVRQAIPLTDGLKKISLVKDTPENSWGILLEKEGNACVVGRAKCRVSARSEHEYLQRGDIILQGCNENDQFVDSPLCASFEYGNRSENWFEKIVELFKRSQELHLVVQRV